MNDKLKDDALKICIDIFNSYAEPELSMVPIMMHKAWLVGKFAAQSPNKKVANVCTCKKPDIFLLGNGKYHCWTCDKPVKRCNAEI